MASTRDAILDGALHVMQTRGLARTTTKEIARAAGYSEATLYKLFDDKFDLFLCVLFERLPTISVADDDAAALAGTGSVAGHLYRLVVEMTGYYRAVLPIGISIFFKDAEIKAAGRTGWHVWERDNLSGVRRPSPRTARRGSGPAARQWPGPGVPAQPQARARPAAGSRG